jgi:serine/threonine protein kinase
MIGPPSICVAPFTISPIVPLHCAAMLAETSRSSQELLAALRHHLVHFDDFRILKPIGQGNFGEVFVAEHLPTGKQVALKKLFTTSLEGSDLMYFCREVSILARCRNFFLLQFLGFTSSFPFCIITEYIENGSLFDAIHHRPRAPNLNGPRRR